MRAEAAGDGGPWRPQAILEKDEASPPSVPGVPSLDAPMPIAGGNRRALDQLFAMMASGDAAT